MGNLITLKYADTNDCHNWRYWRNKVTELVNKGRTSYYRNLIEANIKDSKKLWGLLNEIDSKAKSASPVTLKVGDTTLADPQDISGSFNNFFANIASSILDNMDNHHESSHDNLKHFINSKVDDSVSFNIPLVDYEYVLKELLSLEDGMAVGLDSLPQMLLRLAAHAIAAPLTRIFNILITLGIFPDEWKTAKVVLIHKKDSTQDCGNFITISILSTLSKLLERHIHI